MYYRATFRRSAARRVRRRDRVGTSSRGAGTRSPLTCGPAVGRPRLVPSRVGGSCGSRRVRFQTTRRRGARSRGAAYVRFVGGEKKIQHNECRANAKPADVLEAVNGSVGGRMNERSDQVHPTRGNIFRLVR